MGYALPAVIVHVAEAAKGHQLHARDSASMQRFLMGNAGGGIQNYGRPMMESILLFDHGPAGDGLTLMLTHYLGDHDLVYKFVDLSIALMVVEIARKAEDKEEFFPYGKWAQIQTIEGRCSAEIERITNGN